MQLIEFTTHKKYYLLKEDFPKPVKLNIPKWYKNLSNSNKKKDTGTKTNIKQCMPFLESLTSGYSLQLPVDYKIEYNLEKNYLGSGLSKQDGPVSKFYNPIDLHDKSNFLKSMGVLLGSESPHSTDQLKGSPMIKENGNSPFHKIINPWKIKTPKGYSCIFLNPLNNKSQDYFKIIEGIVHTDQHPVCINFPIILNTEKYNEINTCIPKGTPYVQIIPFKRDNWKMVTKYENSNETYWSSLWRLSFLDRYKNLIWKKNKTSWT